MNAQRAIALVMILLAVMLLVVDSRWANAKARVIGEAERTVVRHDLNHEKGPE